MVYNDTNKNDYTPGSMDVFSNGLVSFFKSIVKESVKEVIQDRMYENVMLDQNLTTKQLCKRWNISENTLHSWENKGIISPIQTGGRKKVYSLRDVREVEVNGYVKQVC